MSVVLEPPPASAAPEESPHPGTEFAAVSEVKLPAAAERGLITSEEFLDWLAPGVHADLSNGEICMHSPVNFRHANLVNLLDRILGVYVEQKDLGVLHRESVAVRLAQRETFMPDLCFFTKAQVARLGPTYAAFAPLFVLEALLPTTAVNDLTRKFTAYELHQVQEYWVLDPQDLRHQFFRRAGDMLEEFAVGEEIIHSTSISGFWVRRAWLNPDELPKVADCLRELLPE